MISKTFPLRLALTISIGGNVNLDANNNEVYLYENGVYAYAQGNTDEGNVNINAEDGDVYIDYGNDIYAAGNVNIMSCGTDNGTGIDIEDGNTIEAGYGDSIGGNININAYNGDLYISGNDTSTDYIEATSGGENEGYVDMYASGTGYIFDTYIDASGDVSIESVDSLTVDSDNSEDIDAGGSISLISDNSNVYVNYYGLYSGGDVDIHQRWGLGRQGTIARKTASTSKFRTLRLLIMVKAAPM